MSTPATAPAPLCCLHCGEVIFWGLARPEDPCFSCGKPVRIPDDSPAESPEDMLEWARKLQRDAGFVTAELTQRDATGGKIDDQPTHAGT